MVTAISEQPIVASRLVLIDNLLEAFHKHGINYCHWKSSEHLAASMTADTDLDVLFDQGQKEQLEQLLDHLGFKRFVSIPQKQYRDIEDFIGIDLGSGKVVHLHAHFRMTLGEAYLKSYQLDIEEQILATKVYDETFGIYRSSPAFELVLLFFREALKLRTRDMISLYLRGRVNCSRNSVNEYRWLRERCTNEEVAAVLQLLFPDYRPVYELVTGPFNRKQLMKLAVIIKAKYKDSRQYSALGARLVRWYREVSVKAYRKLSKLLHRPIIAQRVNPRGGLVIALVGADGSGKSTVSANLKATFRKKLDVYNIYFGRGDGRMSPARKALLFFKKLLVKPKKGGQDLQSLQKGSGGKKGFVATMFKCIEAVMVANEKRKNLKLMQAARSKGMLVICDRFPQNQIKGYNDGPLLHYLAASRNPLFRALAKWEEGVYHRAVNTPPDLLFKLIAEADVVEARKPGETSREMLVAKINGVKQMKLGAGCHVVTVDSSQPLEEVLALVKKEIWKAYR
ncbi:hypothetical protein V9K67_03565 [Paraflavisolibacter sp. H34]|uniref:hypothetical protein n=1 Tax=Huijunlia imazamoxiresistens TaxID=3127457 RepID=UPI00301AEF76